MPVSSSYWHEVQRQVRARAPGALLVYFGLETLSLAYDAITYPERLPLAFSVWAACAALAAVVMGVIRSRPHRSVEAMVSAAATAAVIISGYHALAGASAEWCLLVLTGLLCAVTVFFPWGWRAQLFAGMGAVVGYPAAVAFGVTLQNPLVTGLTYLACVVGLTCYGAELNFRHLKTSFYLTRKLAAREMRLRSYLDQALIGIGVLTPDGTWREVNAALCRMVGWRAEELRGRPWIQLLDPDEIESGTKVLAAPSAGTAPGATVDVNLRTKSGRSLHARVASHSFHALDGTPEETVLMILDITDRKRAQVELEFARDAAQSAYNSKSEFLAHMSHELRTPMNIIFGMTEIAMDESDSHAQLEVLGRTREAAKNLLVLVDEVLDLSRIETGRMRLNPREFDVRAWLDEVVEPLATLASAKGLQLAWAAADDVPERVVGDTDRMRQVVVNLVANAIKFTDSGQVMVRVHRACGDGEERELEFSVEDTGIGISPEHRSRIFEAFVQADQESQSGSGLGLTICARLVDLMGGRIWLESQEGRGSHFHFTFPGRPRFDS